MNASRKLSDRKILEFTNESSSEIYWWFGLLCLIAKDAILLGTHADGKFGSVYALSHV